MANRSDRRRSPCGSRWPVGPRGSRGIGAREYHQGWGHILPRREPDISELSYSVELKRAISRYLETAIAKSILRGEYQAGDTIFVDVEGERLNFQRLSAEMLIN